MASAKNLKTVDVLVIGNTLAGQLLAAFHRGQGRSVLIVHGNQAAELSEGLTYLNYFPDRPESEALLSWAEAALGAPLEKQRLATAPMTFEDGSLREFVGFGDKCPNSVNDIQYLNATAEWRLNPAVNRWFAAEPVPQNNVTKLIVENGRVAAAELNADHSILAREIIYTLSPQHLVALIDGDGLAPKHRQRLAKMAPWSAVTLQLADGSLPAADSNLYFLFGGGQNFEPVWGRGTTWTTLIPSDKKDEHDYVGQVLRNAKRQIRRAFPELPEHAKEERIIFSPDSYGSLSLKTKDPYRLPEIENLVLASPLLSQLGGLFGALDVAKSVVSDNKPEFIEESEVQA